MSIEVFEFDSYEEAKEFCHDTQGDKTLVRDGAKFTIHLRRNPNILRIGINGPIEQESVEEDAKEEEQEIQEEIQEERSDQES